jgi:hypothetical protein
MLGAELPPLYKELARAGRLFAGSPDHLVVPDVRWLPIWDIAAEPLTAFPHIDHLLPFATNPRGDHWCWLASRRSPAGEPDILLCPHDEHDAAVFAPGLAAFLFRNAVEDLIFFASDDAAARAVAMLQTIEAAIASAPALAARLRQQRDQLASAIARGNTAAPLTGDDAERLIREVLGDGYVGQSLPWMFVP